MRRANSFARSVDELADHASVVAVPAQPRVLDLVPRLRASQIQGNDVDWDGVAAVLIGATFHYWFLRDTFCTHPTGTKEERYVPAAVALTTALAHNVDGDET